MKYSVFAVLLVIAGTYALPSQEIETRDQRIISNQIRRIIEQIRQQIREAGLDPLQIDNVSGEYTAVPNFLEIKAFLEGLTFTGASNIAINRLNVNILLSRVDFDLSLPELRLSVVESGFNVIIFGNNDSGAFNGSVSIKQIRLTGQVRYRVGIFTGVSIRSVTLRFSLGSIESNVRLIAFGDDHTDDANTFLNEIIPESLKKYENEINKSLEEFVMGIIGNN